MTRGGCPECAEQARLLGMSAEREASLLAEVAKLRKVASQALNTLENHATGRTLAGGVHITNAANALREQLIEK